MSHLVPPPATPRPSLDTIVHLSSALPPATPERSRYQQFAAAGIQDLKCCVCMDTLQFPLAFPCQMHYCCHTCIHQMVDTHKVVHGTSQQPDIAPSYSYPIQCPMCGDKLKSLTNCHLEGALVPQTGLLLSLIQIVSGLQQHLPLETRLRLPLVDDLSCPYCKKAFSPASAYGERYAHLSHCPERQNKCTRCCKMVSATDLHRHLLEECPSFTCHECNTPGMLWTTLREHTHRSSEATLLARAMSNAYSNASKEACLSHHDDWKQLPTMVVKWVNMAVKHRAHSQRLDKLGMMPHQFQRMLEQYERQWSAQDAAANATSSRSSSPH